MKMGFEVKLQESEIAAIKIKYFNPVPHKIHYILGRDKRFQDESLLGSFLKL